MNDGGVSPLLGMSQRQPPNALVAEQALLGAILANNRVYERVNDFLRPEHFADPIHATIFEQCEARILEGRLADGVTLSQDFENTGLLEEVGGTRYIAQLLASMVGILSAAEYGQAVYDAYLRRRLISIGEAIVHNAFGADISLSGRQQIDVAERALSDLCAGGLQRDRMMTIGEAVSAAIRQAELIYRGGVSPAVMTGMPAVDKALGGLWPGDFMLLAGVPGAGKTALAVQIGFEVAYRLWRAAHALGASPEEMVRQPGVVVFNLEMSAEELGARVAGYRAGISVEKLRSGELDLQLAERLAVAEKETANLPLRIVDCRATSLRLLAAKIRMHLRRQPEILIIVDHLLVLEGDLGKGNSGRDVATVSKAARDLKQLAGELRLPLLVLTHASRASAMRQDPRPTMGDIKWAGEGDADTVAFVHRPIMFMSSNPPPRIGKETEQSWAERRARYYNERDQAAELAELVVAKRRMGATGVFRMKFDGPTTSFGEWAPELNA